MDKKIRAFQVLGCTSRKQHENTLFMVLYAITVHR